MQVFTLLKQFHQDGLETDTTTTTTVFTTYTGESGFTWMRKVLKKKNNPFDVRIIANL